MIVEKEIVACKSCGAKREIPVGHLTEHGKREYLCSVCSENVLERRVEADRRSKKGRLLTED
jgi:DNA-directed RNA polymerase subunit RPC12/RpoP